MYTTQNPVAARTASLTPAALRRLLVALKANLDNAGGRHGRHH